MLQAKKSYSSFSVDSAEAAKQFYTGVLGIEMVENEMGFDLNVDNGATIFVYEKLDHVPAVFTILNFVVDDIDAAVDELVTKGVVFEKYDSVYLAQDEKGIARGKAANQGPDIAWFKDPAGNVLAVLSN